MGARNWRTRKRRDRPPGLVGTNFKMAVRPSAQFRNGRRRADEAKVQLGFIHRSLAGVTFAKKLQDDAFAKISWQRDVRLQRHAFARWMWQQIAQARHSRIASVCADQCPRKKTFTRLVFNFPTPNA